MCDIICFVLCLLNLMDIPLLRAAPVRAVRFSGFEFDTVFGPVRSKIPTFGPVFGIFPKKKSGL